MAPEVVEQTGATSASDVWSLGALVIELITGKPPYHFLEPMPALFRIVNDDNPPLPEFASPVARDFLMQCFQKDPNLRIGARKLLRHPWMLAAKRQADETKRSQLPRWERYESTVQKVQEWNEALKGACPYSLARADRCCVQVQNHARIDTLICLVDRAPTSHQRCTPLSSPLPTSRLRCSSCRRVHARSSRQTRTRATTTGTATLRTASQSPRLKVRGEAASTSPSDHPQR